MRSPEPIPSPPMSNGAEDASSVFFSGALRRIQRCMLIIALAAAPTTWLLRGWPSALGLAAGCAVAYLNFHWLKIAVERLADRIIEAGRPRSSKGIVARFMLRYILMGLGAYGILTVSPASLYGLLLGLGLPVAAIACETAYEVYVALARGL
jgi:ATP synthase I chain